MCEEKEEEAAEPGEWQGLSLVHFSAQLQPFLTHKYTLKTP